MDVASLFDLRGKTALVTGGSGGIGLMIATGLAAAGCKLFIVSRDEGALRAAAAGLPAGCDTTVIAADLGTEDGIARVADRVNTGGPLHILVNNAGTTYGAPIDDFPRKGFEKVVALNLQAPFELTKSLLPALRAAGAPDDPARVINIASIEGFRVPAFESYPYSASKAGMIHLARHMGRFLAKDHISVNTIAPGCFESKMTAKVIDFDDPSARAEVNSPLGGRIGTVEDIAGAVIYLSSRAGAWLSGVMIPVSGGLGTIDG